MRCPLALVCLVLTACNSVAYQPAAKHGFVLDPASDVDDETIASALDATEAPATPLLPERMRLAYYTFDRLRGDSEKQGKRHRSAFVCAAARGPRAGRALLLFFSHRSTVLGVCVCVCV